MAHELRTMANEDAADVASPRRPPTQKTSSKYDFVKVRVWLADHYYTFSRFLISRVLTVTQVSYADSLKISLSLKKSLVDQNRLDITQDAMEEALFSIMRGYGYGEDYIARYRLMTRFNHRRVPLVIMVLGTGCIGKSTLATQLAERLNLSAVLQTDLVYEVSSVAQWRCRAVLPAARRSSRRHTRPNRDAADPTH